MRDFVKGLLKFIGVLAVIALIAGGVLYAFFVKVLVVGHNGMAPTMILGDRVLVWNTTNVKVGDVALCGHPTEAGRFVMGRVVGRRGHTIGFERGQLQISGETPDMDIGEVVEFEDAEIGRPVRMRIGVERILDHEHRVFVREGTDPRMRRPHVVRSGFFLLNDNRTHRGEDSRTFGEVDPSTCIGTVFMRLTAAPSPPAIGNAALDLIE